MSSEQTTTTETSSSNVVDAAVVPMAFSNDFLLKFNCHDKFSTQGKLKQFIAKSLPKTQQQEGAATSSSDQQEQQEDSAAASTTTTTPPVLPGLTRIGKNPKSEIVYLNFDSEENRTHARKLLSENMKFRGKNWVEMNLSKHDLTVTHRGLCGVNAMERERNAKNNNNNSNENNQQEKESGQRRQRQDDNNNDDNDQQANNLAPWFDLPYAAQIKRKEDHCKRVLRVISRYHTRNTTKSAQVSKALREGWNFEGVIESPTKTGYRNNVQVTAGYSADGKPTLGFNAGSMVAGKAAVLPVEAGAATSHPGVAVLCHGLEDEVLAPIRAKYFEPSNIKSMYDKTEQKGFWRRVQFRFNTKDEVMIDIEVCDTQLREILKDEADQVMKNIKNELVSFIKNGERVFEVVAAPAPASSSSEDSAAPTTTTASSSSSPLHSLKVASLQFHVYNGSSVAESDCPREVISGSPTLTETLAGLHFDLSPTDFFQVNRDAMDLLIEKIGTMFTLDPKKTILLDLCSGTGTLGLAFANKVKQIIGIELVATAVENAKKNAERNGVKNAEYICGRVENELPKVLKKMEVMAYYDKLEAQKKQQQEQTATSAAQASNEVQSEEKKDETVSTSTTTAATTTDYESDVIAILDPPRCGVPSSVLKSLRNTPGLKTLIYISCDQRALENNCEPLTKNSTNQFFGEPFLVDQSFGVDLFPQTTHVEMIVSLKRDK